MILIDRRPSQSHPFLDPLTILLLFVAVMLTSAQIQQRVTAPTTITRAGTEARLLELRWTLGEQFGKLPEMSESSAKSQKNQWNTAVELVLQAEVGRAIDIHDYLQHTPEGAFRTCWEAAYVSGSMPAEKDIAIARNGLGDGLAAKLLEASLQAKCDGDIRETRPETLRHYKFKALVLFSVMGILFAGALTGMGMGIRMLVKRKPLPDSPSFQMPIVSVIRVCLGWYIIFLTSATIAGLLNSVIPLGVLAFPVTYLLHAISGIAFICIAEKASPMLLWKRMSKKDWSWISRGFQFLMLALGSVLLLNALMSPFMPQGDPPQKELIDFIRSSKGMVPFMATFGTVALLGPAFEEIFFRGFLLSAMRQRMSIGWALALSSALFGAIHFHAQAIPALAVLGGVMGLAFLRTGNIKTAILVHGCWNGGVFLFQKMLLG